MGAEQLFKADTRGHSIVIYSYLKKTLFLLQKYMLKLWIHVSVDVSTCKSLFWYQHTLDSVSKFEITAKTVLFDNWYICFRKSGICVKIESCQLYNLILKGRKYIFYCICSLLVNFRVVICGIVSCFWIMLSASNYILNISSGQNWILLPLKRRVFSSLFRWFTIHM